MSIVLQHLEKYWVYYFIPFTALFIFLTVFLYEFYLEDLLNGLRGLNVEQSSESFDERIEYIITTVVFSSFGLLVAGAALLRIE
ncbi:MAG: hypothetical protein R8M14_01735 [Ghiorsea sp.]